VVEGGGEDAEHEAYGEELWHVLVAWSREVGGDGRVGGRTKERMTIVRSPAAIFAACALRLAGGRRRWLSG